MPVNGHANRSVNLSIWFARSLWDATHRNDYATRQNNSHEVLWGEDTHIMFCKLSTSPVCSNSIAFFHVVFVTYY